ncbi:ABC transporter permease [Marinimicrobium alkaliphilum]|uniref:ABC transporter permease n=1 Tax=Marinimicrobium alkaliphilum TaxID=2202654 RepID=UPI000DBAD4D0|nr:ABC transporter permease [Marinimicrobium alkaliphilum]
MTPFQFISLLDLKARMSLKSEASKLYLSYLWWVIEPLLWALSFYFVFEILLSFGRDLFFILSGKVVFLWFSKAVTSGSDSIANSRGLINQTNMPKAFFPYHKLQVVLYKQWLVFLVLFCLAAFWGHFPDWQWFWLLPLFVVQYFLIALCTLIAALAVSYVGDMRILINMAMMSLMFMSGIFWDISQIEDPARRDMLLTFNPLAYLIDAYRAIIIRNELYDLGHLAVLGVVCLAGIVFMHWVYHVKSQDIAARVINA